MASKIKIKRSSVANKVPTTSDIDVGELAINTKDQKLYSSNGTSVFQIGAASGGLVTTTTKTLDALKGSDSIVTGVTAAVSTNYLQVANATTLFATKLAVSNAVATYATKASPTTSGLLAHTGRATISTNLAVSGNTTLSGTLVANNTAGTAGYYLRTSGTGIYWSPISAGSTTQYLQVANAVATYATKSNPTTSGLLAHTGRATISTNLAVSGNATVSGTMTATGIVSGSELTSTLASGDEGGQINLTKPPNGTLSGGITIDAYQNKLRFFEQGGSARGVYIDLSASNNGVADNLFIGPTSYGAIGTYIWAIGPYGVNPGSTTAGSNLTPAGEAYDGQNGITGYGVSGTWRAMGNGTTIATLWLRVA